MVRDSLANHRPLSLMMMDMDHFKLVNDNYGHDSGDKVLQQLAKLLQVEVRTADLSARFGGEEFVIVMPGTKMEDAIETAERIRNRIATTPFEIPHEVGTINKTASFGISTLNPMGDTGKDLLKRADTALYDAKESGRNKVLTAKAQ